MVREVRDSEFLRFIACIRKLEVCPIYFFCIRYYYVMYLSHSSQKSLTGGSAAYFGLPFSKFSLHISSQEGVCQGGPGRKDDKF